MKPKEEEIFLNSKLNFSIDNTNWSVTIIEISKTGLSFLLNEKLNKLIKKKLVLENVNIFLNEENMGVMNIEIKDIIDLSTKNQKNYIAVACASDTHSKYRLWEILYYHTYSMKTKSIDFDPKNPPKIPARGLYTESARLDRLEFIRNATSTDLEKLGDTTLDPNKLTSNIEALIGSVEIPVGIAGPLWINGVHASGYYYAPLATTEGALVASATRGATAITKSGGAYAHVLAQRMIRVPLFELENIKSALFFAEWIHDHFDQINEETKKYSRYAELKELDPHVIGKAVHVQFIYETGDASGQNMTTTCTWQACLWILEQMKNYSKIKFDNFIIEGNLSNDKKVTYQSFIKGRGIRVLAETHIPADILYNVLKVTPKELYDTYRGFVTGSIQAGMIGININVANVIAAIFTATGQDIACVHESSIGHFNMDYTDDGLYASMMLPSLIIGTVGGGTNIPQQREALEIVRCSGPGKAYKLAEIIASYCLALDLSTISAIASGQFASAHEKMGRNRPVEFIMKNDLTIDFFTKIIQKNQPDDTIQVNSIEPVEEFKMGSSIITELTAQKTDKLLGHFPYRMDYTSDSEGQQKVDVMVKIKPTDNEVIIMLNSIATLCDARLGQELKKTEGKTGFKGCDIRELAISAMKDPRIIKYMPRTYGVYRNDEREGYIIIQEFLKDMVFMDSADDVSGWKMKHVLTAIEGISQVHSIWYNQVDNLMKEEWIGHYPTRDRMQELTRLWELLGVHARNEFPKWFSEIDLEKFQTLLHNLPEWYGAIDQMPKTLIHNDFNPRNITFRNTEEGLRLCAYDWELATIQMPQRDLVELLAFVLDDFVTKDDLQMYAEYHRMALEKAAGVSINKEDWWEGFRYSCWDLCINRFSMYIMAHTVRHYEFMERAYKTFREMLKVIQ